MTFISRIFDFGIISEFLNSQVSIELIKTAILTQVFSILARTLNSRGTEFPKITEN